jgi:putative spermidine/putrescine transport system substrate-binding protein
MRRKEERSMKKGAKILLLLTMMVLSAAALMAAPAGEGGKKTLVVSTFGLSEDVLWKDVFEPFEKAYNCTVVTDLGNAGDRFIKLKDNPNSTVDVIEVNQKTSADGYAAGLFAKLDYSKIPNAQELIPPVKAMIENGYGPAYTLNSMGIIYNPEATGFEIREWDDLWRPELADKISLPDITTTFGPAIVYVAGDHAGVPVAKDQGEAAFKALADLKKNVKKTYARSADLANLFASGEITAAVVGDFAIPVISGALPTVKYVVPSSGTYANFNTVDVTVNSKNKDLAYAWVNWRISKELQSKTTIDINEAPTNSTVVLTPDQAKNLTYGDVAQRAKAMDYTLVNSLLPQWIDTWNRTLNN